MSTSAADPDVWVTGIGAVGPGGWCVDELWDRVVAGRSAIGRLERFDPGPGGTTVCGTVPGRSGDDPTGEALAVQYGTAAALQAWGDAGLRGSDLVPDFIVVSNHGERLLPRPGHGGGTVATASEITADLARAVGARSSVTVNGACAGGTLAVGAGLRMLRAGMASRVVVGGADCLVRDRDFLGFSVLCAMTTRDCPPEAASCPFDRARDGFVLSEGAAFLVLESVGAAGSRGGVPRAVLRGFGSSQSAYHVVAQPPDGEGPAQAMRAALADAGVAASDVDYVNAHGTSTRDNDLSEAAAIRRVFGAGDAAPWVSSTKSQLGHLMGAAGALEAVLAVRSLESGVVPPTINLRDPDPACALRHVRAAAEERPRTVLSNGFGFGGHCASVLLGRVA